MDVRELSPGRGVKESRDTLVLEGPSLKLAPAVPPKPTKRVRYVNDVRYVCKNASVMMGAIDFDSSRYLLIMPLIPIWQTSDYDNTVEGRNGQVLELFNKGDFGTSPSDSYRSRYLTNHVSHYHVGWLDPLWRDFPLKPFWHIWENAEFLPLFTKHLQLAFPKIRCSCEDAYSGRYLLSRAPWKIIPYMMGYYLLKATVDFRHTFFHLGITPHAVYTHREEDRGTSYGLVLETATDYVVNNPFVLFDAARFARDFDRAFQIACYELSKSLSGSLRHGKLYREVVTYLEPYLLKHEGGLTLVGDPDKGKLSLLDRGRLTFFGKYF